MRVTTVFKRLLRLDDVHVTEVVFALNVIIVTVVLVRRRLWCPHCGFKTSARYDIRSFPSWWRHLDMGTWQIEIRCSVGDGALGMWSALRDVFPETREQRCWVHVTAKVLNALPKSAQPGARKAIAEIRDAEDRAHAEAAIKTFADAYESKWPKPVAKITDKPDVLLCFFDFPAEHWLHLKTTNPICRHSPRSGCEQSSPRARARRPLVGFGIQADRIRPRPVAGRVGRPPRRPGPTVPCSATVSTSNASNPNPIRTKRHRMRSQHDQRPRRQRDDRLPGVRACFEPEGRQRFCSTGCRQQTWRRNRTAPVEPVAARADTVYACPDCDARYLGQRCDECNTWCRRLGPGGPWACCDEPICDHRPPHTRPIPAPNE